MRNTMKKIPNHKLQNPNKFKISNLKKINILGIKVDNLGYKQVIRKIDVFLSNNRDRSKQITTVNPEFVMAAKNDKLFKKIINKSFIATVDGKGLQLAFEYLYGIKIKGRVTGVDLIYKLARQAGKKGYSIYFLGAALGVAEKCAKILKRKNPNLSIAGTYAGSPKIEEEPAILELINYAKPDILLVAYGAPNQDKWIFRNLKNFEKPLVAIGIGGSFDYITGIVPRAPKWIRTLGLEWLFRLTREPKRFSRIITASVRFPLAILKEKAKQ